MNPIQWFPGHMAKTMKELKKELNQVDLIIECIDARSPKSCEHKFFDTLAEKKERVIVLTKTDLANASITASWKKYYKKINIKAFDVNILNKNGLKPLLNHLKRYSDQKREKKQFFITKVMIIGLPNIGKSALINALAKKQATKVQNKPAITKQTQWVTITDHLFLLDTPGVLMPKIKSDETAIKLSLIKCIKDTLFDYTKVTRWFIQHLSNHHQTLIEKRYDITIDMLNPDEIITLIAQKRQCILQNGEINDEKVVRLIIEDFRTGRLGRISFDSPSLNHHDAL